MRILYVEDNMANVSLVKRVARNHEVINYIDGDDALANFEKDDPDLVLMDIQLSGRLTGLDVVRTLRERGHKLPIIAVTAYAMVGDRERCLAAGCDDYIAKPLPIPTLVTLFAKREKELQDKTPTASATTEASSPAKPVAEQPPVAATTSDKPTGKPAEPATTEVASPTAKPVAEQPSVAASTSDEPEAKPATTEASSPAKPVAEQPPVAATTGETTAKPEAPPAEKPAATEPVAEQPPVAATTGETATEAVTIPTPPVEESASTEPVKEQPPVTATTGTTPVKPAVEATPPEADDKEAAVAPVSTGSEKTEADNDKK